MSYNLTGAAYGGNVSLAKAGLAVGSTNTYVTTAAVPYTNKGTFQAPFGVKTNVALPALDAATGKAFVPLNPNEACIFAFFADAAQALNVIQGPKVSTLDLNGGLAAAQFPQGSDALTPFGYMLVSTTGALVGTWLFGTNNFTGVTGLNAVVARDVMDYPAQPITG
jgi:hypothetical protein